METKTGIPELDSYCEGVKSGEIEVCNYVRQAVDRHYKDLARQRTDDFPYYFEPKACDHYVNFFRDELKHYDGVFAGDPIEFEPWQYFTFGSSFGWLKVERIKAMPIRRFNEVIIIVPKKQGKSLVLAGTMLYMLEYDNYPGAQVFALALNQSHAEKLGYKDAITIVQNSKKLSAKYRVNKGAATKGIYYAPLNSQIQPLVSDAEIADGPKIHMAGNDEIKDWDNFELYETLVNGTASDPNALIVNITTAGDDKGSLGYERQEYLKKVLNGAIIDEQTFGVIYTIDKGDEDEWYTERVIKKANPNYGVSIGKDYYLQRVAKAQNNQRKKNDFLTKHLNRWINARSQYFSTDIWMGLGGKKIEDYEGKPCYLVLDLASKKDIASMYALFFDGFTEAKKRKYVTFGLNFLPEAVVQKKLIGRKSEYNAWAEQGHFVLTPGNVIDTDAILDKVKEWIKLFKVMKVGFDEWAAAKLEQDVAKMRVRVIEVPQRTKILSEPMKTLEAWIVDKHPRISHGDDPVLSWALANVVAKEDANENVFPRKEHRDNKIDPAVSLINLIAMEMEEPLPATAKKRIPQVW